MPAFSEQELFALTSSIVDSDPVVSVYAACEWRELDYNGKLWLCAIVKEATNRAQLGGSNVVPFPIAGKCS